MQKRLRKRKKRLDLNQLAIEIVENATTETPDTSEKSNTEGKNPAAVQLGRLGGLKGGKARAQNMTRKQRSEAARRAALIRWRSKR